MHQFDKVEQFALAPPGSASWQLLREMVQNAQDFYGSLGIPHRCAPLWCMLPGSLAGCMPPAAVLH